MVLHTCVLITLIGQAVDALGPVPYMPTDVIVKLTHSLDRDSKV